jgi:hypothetical protein
MNACTFLGIMLILAGSVENAHAGTLGVISIDGGIGTVMPSSDTSLSALIAIGPSSSTCFVVGDCVQIALLQDVTTSSVGDIITLDSSTPGFSAIASTLTGDPQDLIAIGVVNGPSYGLSSGGQIAYAYPNFSGDIIQSLSLAIDSVTIGESFLPPGTAFDIDLTLTVFGVPEPQPGVLVVAGILVLTLARRYRIAARR